MNDSGLRSPESGFTKATTLSPRFRAWTGIESDTMGVAAFAGVVLKVFQAARELARD